MLLSVNDRLRTTLLNSFCLTSAVDYVLWWQDLAHIHEILKNIFLIFPNYCLGRGLMDVAFNEYYNEFCFKMGQYHMLAHFTVGLLCGLNFC